MAGRKVWFVTGASKGLGLALVKRLLANGYSVAATSRTKDVLVKAVGIEDESVFLPLSVDLTSEAAIRASIQTTIDHFGGLNVVVNNAGYGIGGAAEELSSKEIHASFDINVFATIAVSQAAAAYFRQQRSGHVINISSIAGFAPAIGWGMYAATKFAVTGFTEVLAEDVKEFGVKATVVAPGAFRTEFLTDESLVFAENTIEEYNAIRQSHARYASMNGVQAGDPDKAADVFIALAENPEPPVRLFLGTDAYNRAKAKLALLEAELEQWKELSFSTDY